DGAVGGVDVLTACTAGAVNVDFQIAVVNCDIDFFGFRQHRDGGGAGVNAATAFGDRHTLNAVNAAFKLQLGEHALAGDRSHHFLITADLRFIGGYDFDFPPLGVGKATVHA